MAGCARADAAVVADWTIVPKTFTYDRARGQSCSYFLHDHLSDPVDLPHHTGWIPGSRKISANAQPARALHSDVSADRRRPGKVDLAESGVAMDRVIPATLRWNVLCAAPAFSCKRAHRMARCRAGE